MADSPGVELGNTRAISKHGDERGIGPVLRLVVGLGSSRGVRSAAVWSALRLAVPDLTAITAFSTVDRRRDEPGLFAVIRELGAPLYCYPATELDAVDVPHPSEGVRDHVGTRSVAEAAALLAARDLGGGELIVPKLRGEHVTVAVAALHPLSISSACTACGGCLRTCPEHALRPAPLRPTVIATRCISCGECVEICPTDAITLRDECERLPPSTAGRLGCPGHPSPVSDAAWVTMVRWHQHTQ